MIPALRLPAVASSSSARLTPMVTVLPSATALAGCGVAVGAAAAASTAAAPTDRALHAALRRPLAAALPSAGSVRPVAPSLTQPFFVKRAWQVCCERSKIPISDPVFLVAFRSLC